MPPPDWPAIEENPVRLLEWLFGKREPQVTPVRPQQKELASVGAEKQVTAARPQENGPASAGHDRQVAVPRPQEKRPTPASPEKQGPAARADKQEPVRSEAENLKRWRESGQARAWVEAHHGQWDHQDWLSLLDSLKHSGFWPVHPDAVGTVLDEIRHEWSKSR